ncbi:MAG: DUF5906 domain-containing protein [Simkaniaceae bacterium]|nr:DUF5906 domain-containing protein [Candidatus Sacchlamyda saccharinae]
MNRIVSEKTISQHPQSAEEKSKARADELRRLAESSLKSKENEDPFLNQEQISLKNAIVEELNQTLAVVHTSSTYILIEKDEIEFVLDSKTSLLTLYENQPVLELAGENKKPPTKAQIWLRSPNRRSYDKIVFNPKIEGHYRKNYNIWKGFALEPKKGDCSLYWAHVRDIICCGKESHYVYTRKWLSRLIQAPWLIDTSIVLRGKQGTGKGTFVDPIGKLFGPHFAPLASLDKILGRFNSHLKNAILIYADEAIWGGNKKEVGLLKALITEKKLFIEGKGKDGYWIDNFKHLIVSSNENWAVHLDPDDRRFFVLDVADDRKEDLPYFNKIHEQLENGGYEALMYDLLNEDLTDFDPRIMPENFSGFDMKLEGAPNVDRFIYTSLKEGCWDHANASPSDSLKDLIIDHFYECYKNWCEYEHLKIMHKEEVGKRLRAIIPKVTSKRSPREEDRQRRSKYIFPNLETCQSSFENFYKQSPSIWEWS